MGGATYYPGGRLPRPPGSSADHVSPELPPWEIERRRVEEQSLSHRRMVDLELLYEKRAQEAEVLTARALEIDAEGVRTMQVLEALAAEKVRLANERARIDECEAERAAQEAELLARLKVLKEQDGKAQ